MNAPVVPASALRTWDAKCLRQLRPAAAARRWSDRLRLPNIGVTRVENFCAGGLEAIRGGLAAGACDIALAVGVES